MTVNNTLYTQASVCMQLCSKIGANGRITIIDVDMRINVWVMLNTPIEKLKWLTETRNLQEKRPRLEAERETLKYKTSLGQQWDLVVECMVRTLMFPEVVKQNQEHPHHRWVCDPDGWNYHRENILWAIHHKPIMFFESDFVALVDPFDLSVEEMLVHWLQRKDTLIEPLSMESLNVYVE
jgi:hypothetical protein